MSRVHKRILGSRLYWSIEMVNFLDFVAAVQSFSDLIGFLNEYATGCCVIFFLYVGSTDK